MLIRCEIVVSYIPSFLNLPADMLSRGRAGRKEFDEMAIAFGWNELEEIKIANHSSEDYYEDLRILKEPINLPDWTDYVPGRKSRYANPELFKLWAEGERY